MDEKYNLSKGSPRREHVKWQFIERSYPVLFYDFDDYLAIHVALLLLLNIISHVDIILIKSWNLWIGIRFV